MYVSKVYIGTNQGQQVNGLQMASHSYLSKPLAELTDAQFSLVATIKAPNHFHPVRNRPAYDLRHCKP